MRSGRGNERDEENCVCSSGPLCRLPWLGASHEEERGEGGRGGGSDLVCHQFSIQSEPQTKSRKCSDITLVDVVTPTSIDMLRNRSKQTWKDR
ncbi:hypothetical protein EYF80_021258 [Liparis tanakae]|uniref:Uncharacterized protein n=1 Tax=Liparis tanakae TaxID=230148 RepID=A0A4Z2HU48_9TELE|nr:hypothetical protein EYF80_021258 [Liparis tanakae]